LLPPADPFGPLAFEGLQERGEPFLVNGDLGVVPKKVLYSPLFPGNKDDAFSKSPA